MKLKDKQLENPVGNLLLLTTNAKTDVVSALNEVKAGSSGSPTWGSITGTLSNQTDLNTALGTKSPLVGSSSIVTVGTLSAGSIPYTLLTGTPTLPIAANPTGSAGLAIVNGSATTFMRSDGSPAISQTIVPTWTGIHTFNATNIVVTSTPQLIVGTATAATSGVPVQYSGMLTQTGLAWNPTATASQDVNFGWEVEPTSANPVNGLLVLRSWVNGGAKSSLLNISNTGQFTSSNLVVLNQGFFGSTSTDVLIIQNNAAATVGATLQKSGRTRYQGSIWNTTATAAANYFSFSNEASGVSGLIPTGALDWYGGLSTTTTVTLTKLMSLDALTGNLTLQTGGLILATAGSKFNILEGTNSKVGQTTLVAGTKAITITGLTTSSRAFVQLVTPSGGSLTIDYQVVCTSNTMTIQANVAAGTINTSDVSVLNYFIVN